MIHAYNKEYVSDAMENLGEAFDYAVHAQNLNLNRFSSLFVNASASKSIENGNPKYMDKDGNSLKELAMEELIEQRNIVKDGGASQSSIDRFISERPLKPQEAVLELGKNIFPRKLLMDQLTKIRTNKMALVSAIILLSNRK